MSGYNLPDDVTHDMIDEAYGSDHIEWTCPDPECGERWSDVPEMWECAREDCTIVSCPVCEAACLSCGDHFCLEHRQRYDDGSGKLAWWCDDCIANAKAQEEVA